MVDIYSFIDSKDIREYNRQLGTKFTPIEQAVLIYHSDLKTVEEKLAAWHELIDAYNEEDFSEINLPDGGKVTNRDIMFGQTYRQKVEITVKAFEKALKLKSNTEGMLYIVKIYADAVSQAYDHNYEEVEFSSFEKAYEYICTSKEREFLDYSKAVASTMNYSMRAIPLDEADEDTTEFIFDNNFRMTQIYFHYTDEKYGLDYVFIYVPLPFKKGDIVRDIFETSECAIVPRTPDKEYFLHAYDSASMQITALCLSERNGEIVDDYDHYPFLSLERCSEEDLPQDSYFFNSQRFLKLRNKI